MSDDNVVFQNSTELYARLQQAKRPFEMMVYPGATHAIAGEGPQTHVWTTITRFLDEKVLGKPLVERSAPDRLAVDQPRVEVPGRIAEPRQHEGQADEQRDRADDEQAERRSGPSGSSRPCWRAPRARRRRPPRPR